MLVNLYLMLDIKIADDGEILAKGPNIMSSIIEMKKQQEKFLIMMAGFIQEILELLMKMVFLRLQIVKKV